MDRQEALEIQAASKIGCDHDELAPCGDKCPRRVAGVELECRFEDGYHHLTAVAEGYLEATTNLSSKDGCPKCGNEDIQTAELLTAWKKVEELEAHIEKFQDPLVLEALKATKENAPPLRPDWKDRYGAIKEAYLKTRLEVSGSFGNWDYATRKRVLENEISVELGFRV